MLYSTGLIVASIFATVSLSQSYQYINCDLPNEMDDIYVVGNAVYLCNRIEEIVEYCVICDTESTSLSGRFISRTHLKTLQGGQNLSTNEDLDNFCNGLKIKSCQEVERTIPGAADLPQKKFCTLGSGTVRRFSSVDSSTMYDENCGM